MGRSAGNNDQRRIIIPPPPPPPPFPQTISLSLPPPFLPSLAVIEAAEGGREGGRGMYRLFPRTGTGFASRNLNYLPFFGLTRYVMVFSFLIIFFTGFLGGESHAGAAEPRRSDERTAAARRQPKEVGEGTHGSAVPLWGRRRRRRRRRKEQKKGGRESTHG